MSKQGKLTSMAANLDDLRFIERIITRHGWPSDEFDAASAIVELFESRDEAQGADINLAFANEIAGLKIAELIVFYDIEQAFEIDPAIQSALERGSETRLLVTITLPNHDWTSVGDAAFYVAMRKMIARHVLSYNSVKSHASEHGRAHYQAWRDMASSHLAVFVDPDQNLADMMLELRDAHMNIELSEAAIRYGIEAFYGRCPPLNEAIVSAIRGLSPSVLNGLATRLTSEDDFVAKAVVGYAVRSRTAPVETAPSANTSSQTTSVSEYDGIVIVRKPSGKQAGDAERAWRTFEAIADKPLKPIVVGDLHELNALADAWPHARDLIWTLKSDLIVGKPMRFRPTLIVGAPGTGKTTLLQAVAKALRVPVTVFPCASSSDNAFGGTPLRWSSASPSMPLELIRQSATPNPVVILDELEKGGRNTQHGSLVETLLPMLERHTASTYFETGLNSASDLSHVSFLATANSLNIPAPLRDRFRVLHMPDPGPEHIADLCRRIVGDIARERDQAGMIDDIDREEEDVIRRAWGGGSLRRLRRAVEVTIDVRERWAVRQ